MKWDVVGDRDADFGVAPFTGAWIEIMMPGMAPMVCSVAPFTGAWIEIKLKALMTGTQTESHPSRVRGLKYRNGNPAR